MSDENAFSLPKHKIALLIDGDNAQPSLLPQILMEAARYGQVTIRRIYGDWTTANMSSWKEMLNYYAFQPIQQFRYTVGKNATDSAMIIDAMDILHAGVVDGFCLVSSDSDYTRLATRIRESGIFVMGIGQKKTPKAFVNACDVFVYTENLEKSESQGETKPRRERKQKKGGEPSAIASESTESRQSSESPESSEQVENPENDPLPLLRKAYEMAAREDGWARLDAMGSALYQLDPGFDPRTYGHRQLSRLVGSLKEVFEMRTHEIDGSTLFYVRLRENL
ncbi:MAG: NYN domain-containing protein [Chloroflexi bacterium]|nr:NYN domain-containing protein [Chloroflexota bacterium]